MPISGALVQQRDKRGTQTFQSVRPAEFYSADVFLRGLPIVAGLETRCPHRPKPHVPTVSCGRLTRTQTSLLVPN
jgi:hypothetical protein